MEINWNLGRIERDGHLEQFTSDSAMHNIHDGMVGFSILPTGS